MIRIIFIFALWIGWSSYQLTRGKSVAPSTFEMTDFIKSTDKMRKRLSLSEFIARSKDVHGNKYGYSLITNYKNNATKVPIICNKCKSVFYQTPNSHLSGHGCYNCTHKIAGIKRRKSCFGIGVFDKEVANLNKNELKIVERAWRGMLRRCYSSKRGKRSIRYTECEVCKEWHTFSNFAKWFVSPENGYMDGYQIDKDILVKGNKVYSPDTCCFVPQEINTIFTKRESQRTKYYIGVYTNKKKFAAYLHKYGVLTYIGLFPTPEEAFYAYKVEKEAYIKEVAQSYYNKGLVTERVYNALMNYNVEITD